jgi:hypothetical protein
MGPEPLPSAAGQAMLALLAARGGAEGLELEQRLQTNVRCFAHGQVMSDPLQQSECSQMQSLATRALVHCGEPSMHSINACPRCLNCLPRLPGLLVACMHVHKRLCYSQPAPKRRAGLALLNTVRRRFLACRCHPADHLYPWRIHGPSALLHRRGWNGAAHAPPAPPGRLPRQRRRTLQHRGSRAESARIDRCVSHPQGSVVKGVDVGLLLQGMAFCLILG